VEDEMIHDVTLNRRRFLQIVGTLSSCAIAPALAEAREHSEPFSWQGSILGASSSMKLFAEDKPRAKRIIKECLEEAHRLERIFSLFIPNSSIRQLNRQGSLSNPPEELLEVIRFAQTLSSLSEGVFDISVQPLWSYLYYLEGQSPNLKEIQLRKALVDYRKINVSREQIFFEKKNMEITLNGIAQGYITDRISSLLRSRGVNRVLVDFGEMYALGRKSQSQHWKVAIRNPESNIPFAKLGLEDRAIATSAAYGLVSANKFSHLLNPQTAQSIKQYNSLSIVADSALEADGLSTTLSLLEECKHSKILKHFPGAKVIIF
jgi:thiamine biosynthesis lipoprotein